MTLWLCNYNASVIRKLRVITMYLDRYLTYRVDVVQAKCLQYYAVLIAVQQY